MNLSAPLAGSIHENNSAIASTAVNHMAPKLAASLLRRFADQLKQTTVAGRSGEDVRDDFVRLAEEYAATVEAHDADEL